MLQTFLLLCIVVPGIAIILGWKHQLRKTPEEQHLDLLIDLNDPDMVPYAAKLFGPLNFGAVEAETGQMFVLI